MDLFKFPPMGQNIVLAQGQAINNIDSIMWVERYSEPGEFEIQTKLSTGLREFLPLGTLISHVDTYELMIVENHEITENTTADPTLKITGRSFVSWLEQRIVGMDLARSSPVVRDYNLASNYSWLQIIKLINDHIAGSSEATDNTNVFATHTISGTSVQESRTINRGNVLERVLELLAFDDLGIKSVRQNAFPGGLGNTSNTIFLIHAGVDRSASVIFSWKGGDLDGADYLFSNKNAKNAALVVGQYVFRLVDSTGTPGYNKRVMIVDGSDIDGYLNAPPTGGTATTIYALMDTRGRQALKAQNTVTISQASISDITKFQYRKDYNVGDLVSLDGDFGQIAVMRVTEYAEIEDENGESGHPTLSILGA